MSGHRYIQDPEGTHRAALDYCTQSGGYFVVFWSHHARDDAVTLREIELAKEPMFRSRFLIAQLDDTPIPHHLFLEDIDAARWSGTTPRLECVQLYGDDERGAQQRLDDLLVRLYWLIYRNRALPGFWELHRRNQL